MTHKQFVRFVKTIRFDAIDSDLGECWTWTGTRRAKEYGRFCEGVNKLAHRVSYAHFIGRIPDGLEIDHLCRNKLCVNPRHLEPVAHLINIRRGLVPGNQHNIGHRHSVESRSLMSTAKRAWWTDDRRAKFGALKRLWWARKRDAA